mmetsp:Transcript_125239/g.217058  ORF Transcript_125239/g.217058 Transcript_125239/m.217058 type:complete len:114 (+) Transcript_125239:3188-3529(+)
MKWFAPMPSVVLLELLAYNFFLVSHGESYVCYTQKPLKKGSLGMYHESGPAGGWQGRKSRFGPCCRRTNLCKQPPSPTEDPYLCKTPVIMALQNGILSSPCVSHPEKVVCQQP